MKKIFQLLVVCIVCSSLYGEFFVTIYNNDLALVKERREIELQKGKAAYRFENVPAAIDPTSVHLSSLTNPGNITILEQNYEYDLVSEQKLLEKYIGNEIIVTTKEGKEFKGTLLSPAENLILRDETGKVIVVKLDGIRNIIFPSLPEGLILRPSLFWLLDVSKGGKEKVEISYLTKGLSWEAKYVAVANKDDTRLSFDGWVSITNSCGLSFPDARLKLVAGEPHIIKKRPPRGELLEYAKTTTTVPQFVEEEFFEYHLYTLQRPATLLNNQKKELSLFPQANVNVKKIYTFDQTKGNRVRVELEFSNSKDDGLGLPLPKGKVRAYKEDSEGMLQFIGEDEIDHTPKDENVQLYIGDAFDLIAERTQKEYKSLGDRGFEATYSIKLRNHKKEKVEIQVLEKIWGDWFITNSNFKYEKKDANTIKFLVQVEPNKESEIIYTVRVNF